MKKKEKYHYVLSQLWEEENRTIKMLEEFCLNRNIVASKDEFSELINDMENKHLISTEGKYVKALITKNEYESGTFSAFSQTFANNGSQDKMIFTPPSTNVSLK